MTIEFFKVSGATILTLLCYFDFTLEQVHEMFEKFSEVWDEAIREDTHDSILTLCENETGVELTINDKKSFHSEPALDFSLSEAKTIPQWIYRMEVQIRWMNLFILAAVVIALYRIDFMKNHDIQEFMGYYEAYLSYQSEPALVWTDDPRNLWMHY